MAQEHQTTMEEWMPILRRYLKGVCKGSLGTFKGHFKGYRMTGPALHEFCGAVELLIAEEEHRITRGGETL